MKSATNVAPAPATAEQQLKRFIQGASLPDSHKLLLGSGNQTRFIRLESAAALARPAVRALFAAAIARARAPFRTSGRTELIIRSIAKKQRPRRKPA